MFVVSDKRFYWLKVRRLLMSFSYANVHLSHSALNLSDKVLTLCEEHNWEELDVFASERKSPIGWEPFLQLAKKNNAPREVQSRWGLMRV